MVFVRIRWVRSACEKELNNLTHDTKLVDELFPCTIVMDDGLIVADGDTKEILADAKLLEAHGLEKP